ncbi:MAG: hypothetical protein K0S12_582, partial [Bacteroidetes bacterium]|nr:hypothetical protein [Bacteroidota bacterium]
IWSKTFHKRNFTDLSVTKSGKVVIGGSTMNAFCTDTSAYYMLDVDGTELWQRIGDYAQCGTLPFTNDNNENTYTLGYIKVNTAYIPKVNIVNGAGNVINQITTLPNPKLINISDDLSVYVVSTIQGPSSNCTVIATKYDQSANIVWSKSLTGKGFDITCIRSDSTGLYIAGSIYQFMSFDNINFTSKGLIIIKTDNCGNMVWSKRTNGNYGNITINDFAVAPDQSLLLTGMIQSTHSFDSFSVTGDPDYYDMYLAKLIQPGVPADVKKKDNVYPDFNLYPLPTSGFFVVNYSREKTSGSIRVRIFNALGQIVYSGNETFQKSYTRDFDLSCQSKGVYFVELSAENLRLIKRVIIE